MAVGRGLVGVTPDVLHGADIDPVAVAITRVRLQAEFGGSAGSWRRAIRCVNSLKKGVWGGRTFDLVVGNPPFLNQLRQSTVASRAEARELRERFGGAVGRYADLACAFLMLASELMRPRRGRVALVLPMSVLATEDALPVREAVAKRASISACLVPPTNVFGGGVPTVVLVLDATDRAAERSARVFGIAGAEDAVNAATVPQRELTRGAWSALAAAARGVPHIVVAGRNARVLADVATASADFRQHYYGLKGHLSESAVERRVGATAATGRKHGTRKSRGTHAPIATVGSVDAARLTWGVNPVKLLGRQYQAPVVDLSKLRKSREMSKWIDARLVPKIMVATQTRGIEAWVDERGAVLPSTPLISVTPRRRRDLWRVAAALSAPPVCAVAWKRHAGAGMSAGALKLSARQVLALPQPQDTKHWDAGARLFKMWQMEIRPTQREARLLRFAQTMCRAYGLEPAAHQALISWWQRSIEPRRARVLLNSSVSA